MVADYANQFKDPTTRLPASVPLSGSEAYFHIMEYEDDRTFDVH